MSTPITVETTGLHPATANCLQALQWLHAGHKCTNALEIGCGSGILSLATAALWNCHVLAADISPQAVEATQKQCAQHGMGHLVTPLRSDGFHEKAIKNRAPYDLIICNLLAEPITGWAPLMHSHLTPGGICLLSGILAWLAPGVEQAYGNAGFVTIHSLHQSPWVTYVMRPK